MRVCVHVCVSVPASICVCVCMCVHVCACVCECACLYMRVCVCVHEFVCSRGDVIHSKLFISFAFKDAFSDPSLPINSFDLRCDFFSASVIAE